VDFVIGLPTSIDPRTNKPCDAILVVVDKFTKYALYIATTKKLDASAFATLFFHHIYRPFGLPQSITSDRASLFSSHFWDAMTTLLAIKRRMSTAYHPQTDGQTERQNQILEHYLRTFCAYDQADWAYNLSLAEHVYNNAYHSAIRSTPALLLFGFQPRDPSDPPPPNERHVPAAEERIRILNRKREEVHNILVKANAGYEKWYNKKRIPCEF
jgi:transposase InsO family protein